jgi:secreted PhoX family phosphatase
MCTRDDRRGNVVFGTLANCAMGVTPWGTYLTCEENFNAYFKGLPTSRRRRRALRHARAGPATAGTSMTAASTWPASRTRPTASAGWSRSTPGIPASVPVKHTALGRFKHEGAMVTLAGDGRVVVYMGDDEPFEYLYKYVSRDRYDAGHPAAAAGLLEAGPCTWPVSLPMVAATGLALEHGQNGLTEANGFADQADILIRTRQAADLVGATKMDRPEWMAVHPQKRRGLLHPDQQPPAAGRRRRQPAPRECFRPHHPLARGGRVTRAAAADASAGTSSFSVRRPAACRPGEAGQHPRRRLRQSGRTVVRP